MAHESDPDVDRAAQRIAAAVRSAWHGRYSGGDYAVPMSVVAALSLLSRRETVARAQLSEAAPATVASNVRAIWGGAARARPDLLMRLVPLIGPISEPRDESAAAQEITVVARAAIDAGLFRLMGDPENRANVDLLGYVLSALRSGSDTPRAWGQFLTPPDVARLLALFQLTDVRPGGEIADVCSGTGALLLGAAQILRERGIDPASLRWSAVDRDPLAAACLAVNTHLWGLGTDVLIGCADVLTTAQWQHRARIERRQGTEVLRLGLLARATDHLTHPAT